MPYTIQQLEDLPVPTVINTISSPLDIAHELPQNINELDTFVAGITGDPVYVVIDMSDLHLNMGDLVQGLASAFSPPEGIETQNVSHNRVKSVIVGANTLLKIAARSAGQDQYGNRQMEWYPTLDEALTHIKQAGKA